MRIRALALLPVLALLAPAPAQASGPLSPEQQALLGCGPLWGSACPPGVDLMAAEASALFQSWPDGSGPEPGSVWLGPGPVVLPPSRGPILPSGEAGSLPGPPGFPGFANELSAVSWNFLMLLVSLHPGEAPNQFDPSNPYAHYDPADPSTSANQGQCSFLQPQYCAFVQALFDVVPPAPPPAEPVVEKPRWRGHGGGKSAKRAGCLPSARGLAGLSARPAIDPGRRAGRCPKR